MRIRRSAIGLFLFAILGANIQFTSANAATLGSGTPCEVVVTNAVENEDIAKTHVSGSRQCTYTFSFKSTLRTITLPAYLDSATITLTGARGGLGGPRTNASTTTNALDESWVGVYSITIPSPSSKQIDIYTGGIGTNGTSPLRDSTFKPGPSGGTNAFGSGYGGNGGGQRGKYVASSMYSSGMGGGGGASTIAVIDGYQIFAGGGGGTGGVGRQSGNNNLQSGAAFSNPTLVTSTSNGVAGQDNYASDNDGSCYSNSGAGGGGGGGFKGGDGGDYGSANCTGGSYSPSTSGYPGSNGATFLFGVVSNTHVKSTNAETGSSGGRAVIVISYQDAVASLTIPSGDLVYRQATNISVTPNVAGKITFRVNGKVLPGCKGKAARAEIEVTCSYKPSTRNFVTVLATLNPTSSDYLGTVSSSARFFVANRTGPRVR